MGDAIIAQLGLILIALLGFVIDRRKRAEDRTFELRRKLLLNGVVAAQQAIGCVGSIGNVAIKLEETTGRFQTAVGEMTAAMPVASVGSIRSARAFLDDVGPTLLELIIARADPRTDHMELQLRCLSEVARLDARLRDLISYVRIDIGIDSPAESAAFLEAATADLRKFEEAKGKLRAFGAYVRAGGELADEH